MITRPHGDVLETVNVFYNNRLPIADHSLTGVIILLLKNAFAKTIPSF